MWIFSFGDGDARAEQAYGFWRVGYGGVGQRDVSTSDWIVVEAENKYHRYTGESKTKLGGLESSEIGTQRRNQSSTEGAGVA